MTGQFPCQWLARSVLSAAPSLGCFYTVWLSSEYLASHPNPRGPCMNENAHTHTHTHLALVNAFPSSLPSTPLETDIPSKKAFIREKSAFSLSLFFSLCISLHFSLSLSFCRLLTQSFNTMNEQWVLCTPLNFQIQCVCVFGSWEERFLTPIKIPFLHCTSRSGKNTVVHLKLLYWCNLV